MGRVIHFEITADDTDRAKKFYEIFDWTIDKVDMPGDPDYFTAKTGEDSEPGTNGAIMTRRYKSQPTIIWIDVDDLDAMVEKVKAAGGKVAGEKQTVPGVGDTIYINDTEGNIVGLMQPLTK